MAKRVAMFLAVAGAAALLAAAPCLAQVEQQGVRRFPRARPAASPEAVPAAAAEALPAAPADQEEAADAGAAAPSSSEGATSSGEGPVIRPGAEKFVGLNFDYADVNVVIQTVAEILGMNYILAPGVSGKVTIQTSGKIAVSELFVVLEKILEVNNLTAIKSGDFYKIIPLGSVNREALPTVPEDGQLPVEGSVIKIFKLRHLAPSETARLFGGLKSPQGSFITQDPQGILIIVDTAPRIRMFSELIAAVDVDVYRDIQVELHPVANAQAEELAKDLTQVLTAVTTVPGRPAPRFKLIPVKSINSLLFVSADPALGGLLRSWIRDLDQPATTEAEKVFVYSLNHASAENVAGILRDLYGSDKGTTAAPRVASAPQAAQTIASRTASQRAEMDVRLRVTEDETTGVSGKVKVVADKDTNSLIIQTAPWNYPSIVETIKRLDKTPEQVLIEVTIAEITLDDTDKLGLEWALKTHGSVVAGGERFNLSGTAQATFNKDGLVASAAPGFSYLVAEAGRVTAVLNAYAKASKLNIISRPHIIASDNKEAKIDIGQEVPIITTQTRTGEDSTANQVDQTIEYRSTGVILTVTPRVNENRDVTLDVTQEVSEAQTNQLGGTLSPIIIKRTAKTTMTVHDNQTLVIGGLIQEKRERAREGIPLLSRLPIIGYLFGATTDTHTKTEMVVMITPKVITSPEEGDRITGEIKDRTVIFLKKGATGTKEQ